MRSQRLVIGCVAFFSVLAHGAGGQAPPSGGSSHIGKEWTLGSRSGRELEQSDGKIDDPNIIRYLQRLENKLANAAGAPPAEVRLTRSSDLYVSMPAEGVLYISGGLLQRIENEAELAGLLMHELAHGQADRAAAPEGQGTEAARAGCVLQSKLAPGGDEKARERELAATTAAIGYLKAAGYDPAGVLDLFSKLAYEHPAWAKAIVPEDLLALRVKVEAEPVPAGGYRVGSSEFVQVHAMVETALARKH